MSGLVALSYFAVFALGVFAGVSVSKIKSWLAAEETRVAKDASQAATAAANGVQKAAASAAATVANDVKKV